MNPETSLELKGNFTNYPFAELLMEIAHAKLTGSLRASSGEKKLIVYFREGDVVYAVSNQRTFRLYNVLLRQHKIDQQTLTRCADFANDVVLADKLRRDGLLSASDLDDFTVRQIREIAIDTLAWNDGEFAFSPLARLKEDMVYNTDIYSILVEYARCLPVEVVTTRFKSIAETFTVLPQNKPIELELRESYLLSVFSGFPMSLADLKANCSLPPDELLQSLYVLWLSGFLERNEWNTAFSAGKLEQIRNAKVTLKNVPLSTVAPAVVEIIKADTPAATVEKELSLEEYLERLAKAENSYDVLAIEPKASSAEIKSAYFTLAKSFHPDRFHREGEGIHRQVQAAFANLAHAYETLKTPEARESYDFKIRKELEMRAKRVAEGIPDSDETADPSARSGVENFEIGLDHLSEERFGEAAQHFARAVHSNPENALYHSYYGHVLSYSETFRHKAESELQIAAKLEPTNPKIRLMLVDFFIDMNMIKRAEGELNRFLEIVPNNREARDLLTSLKNQSSAKT